MRREARAGEDDVAGDGEAVEVLALLEAEADSRPEAVLRVGGENADLLDVLVAPAIDPGVAGDEQFGGEVLPAVPEEVARGEAELQPGEASAGADLQLVVRVPPSARTISRGGGEWSRKRPRERSTSSASAREGASRSRRASVRTRAVSPSVWAHATTRASLCAKERGP